MSYSKIANRLYDISRAYFLLREKELMVENEMNIQPIIIFTDASLRKNIDVATFAIVAINISKDFCVPDTIIRKYNIQSNHDKNQSICKLTGLITNYNPHAAEIMGILSALEIFSYLAKETNQKIVFYTDSLIAKKVLSDKRMPPNSKLYINFRKYFNKMVNQHSLDVKIKKVAAHQGIELNELADSLAKKRLKSI
jgi:ribonuclease HI